MVYQNHIPWIFPATENERCKKVYLSIFCLAHKISIVRPRWKMLSPNPKQRFKKKSYVTVGGDIVHTFPAIFPSWLLLD